MSESPNPRRLARTKLEARRARVARVHRRTAVFAVALMLAVWVAIFAQLALGSDPALAPKHTPVTSAGTPRAPAIARRVPVIADKPVRRRHVAATAPVVAAAPVVVDPASTPAPVAPQPPVAVGQVVPAPTPAPARTRQS